MVLRVPGKVVASLRSFPGVSMILEDRVPEVLKVRFIPSALDLKPHHLTSYIQIALP